MLRRVRWLPAAVVLGVGGRAMADGAPCAAAALRSADASGVPARLLQAISLVESAGRPWSVNVDGRGYAFEAKPAAIAFVRAAQGAGARYIDVGCFQIDLHYHPDAFADLETAFDPAANAEYAARFLVSLRGGDADWDGAIAAYHSRDAGLGRGYRDRVGDWRAGRRGADGAGWFAGVRIETPGGGWTGGRGLPVVYGP